MTAQSTAHGAHGRTGSGGATVAGVVVLLLVAAFGANVLLAVALPPHWPLPVLQLVVTGGTVAVAVPLTYWSGRRLRPARSLTDRGLGWDRVQRLDALVGLGLGVVAATLPLAVAAGAGAFTPVAALDQGDLALLPGLGLMLIAMALVALWEELLLRGVLIGEVAAGLTRHVPPGRAAAMAVAGGAVLFGLGHAGQPDRPVLLATWIVAGLVFGAIYVLDGKLGLVIGAHAGFNIGHNAVAVRAGTDGTERLSALLRVEQVVDHWWLSPGGVIELAGFLLLAVFALVWLQVRRAQPCHPRPPGGRRHGVNHGGAVAGRPTTRSGATRP